MVVNRADDAAFKAVLLGFGLPFKEDTRSSE